MSDVFNNLLDEMEPAAADEHFVIDNDAKAEWALNKIRAEEKEAQRLKDICREQIEKYQLRYEDIDERVAHKTDWLRGLLMDYFESGIDLKRSKGGMESYQLPSGRLVRKHVAPQYVRDDETLLDWCKQNMPECVQTIQKPMWGEIKKHTTIGEDGTVYMQESGEVLPGIKAEAQPDVFKVEVQV